MNALVPDDIVAVIKMSNANANHDPDTARLHPDKGCPSIE
jgi:hypothetical protein